MIIITWGGEKPGNTVGDFCKGSRARLTVLHSVFMNNCDYDYDDDQSWSHVINTNIIRCQAPAAPHYIQRENYA